MTDLPKSSSETTQDSTERICIDLNQKLLKIVDMLKREYGAQSRARAIEILLEDLLEE